MCQESVEGFFHFFERVEIVPFAWQDARPMNPAIFHRPANRWLMQFILFAVCLIGGSLYGAGGHEAAPAAPFPIPLSEYHDDHVDSLWARLEGRVKREPFNLIATILFGCAILHTFLAGQFLKIAHRIEEQHHRDLEKQGIKPKEGRPEPVSFRATLFHFLGEVEAVFGIWIVPLFIALIAMHGWGTVTSYVDHLPFAEPIFVVVIMAMAATRPVIKFAEKITGLAASLGGGSLTAWWFSILTLLPILGSFITEPAAMTIAAMLLGQKIYALNPSRNFKYATLGALFVAVSVGGTLTHFAAPPVLMVAGKWGLTTSTMLVHFGGKAVAAILTFNILLFFVFRKELASLDGKQKLRQEREAASGLEDEDEPVPAWITLFHLLFLAWTVFTLHNPPLVVGGFLFFIAFTVATLHHQYQLQLKGPVLVGFFLAGLVVHGTLQSWWIAPILSELGEFPLFLGATVLTAFNDNAAITYLASLVPAFDPAQAADIHQAHHLQYSVLTGAVTGGGLTVIANAPNPAGQSILARFFSGGISPLGLFLGALVPTIIVSLYFVLIHSFN